LTTKSTNEKYAKLGQRGQKGITRGTFYFGTSPYLRNGCRYNFKFGMQIDTDGTNDKMQN